MRLAFYFLILAAFFVLFTNEAYATHLRAGEIIVERDPTDPTGKTFLFTLILYRDTKGVDQQNATLDYGDGTTETVDVSSKTKTGTGISNDIERLEYKFKHTYSTSQARYTVSFTEQNRNDGVLNMIQSVQTAFHIETTFSTDPTLGLNNSVVFRNPPVDLATVGQRFCHNPAAFDADGDSLSYRLVVPFKGRGTPVDGYQPPNRVGPPLGTPESGMGEPTFTINPVTGDLCWDSPGARKTPSGVISNDTDYGLYNVAFIVEEWRRNVDGYVRVGEVRRDMQIIVRGNKNKRPELEVPPDTCIVAGTVLTKEIKATDPDRHRVSIGSESAIFSTDRAIFPNQPGATLTPFANIANPAYRNSPAVSTFNWRTECLHVRAQPYDVVFRVEDDPPVPPFRREDRLTDTKTWRIRVVGPKITGLKATPSGKSMLLTWDPYTCPNASEIIIWRKVGCTADTIDPCKTGTPAGYEEVGRVSAKAFSFRDDNKGKGLKTGIQYSYRVGAVFAPPARGESAPSDAVCARLLLEIPMITKVSVDKTDERAGQISVAWTQPLEIDRTAFPGPYKYELYRATGLNSRAFGTPIKVVQTNNAGFTTDTTFTDTNLNTVANGYNYVLLFYTGNQFAFKDSSQTASSVRLTVTPRPKAIELSWQANVPWDNTNQTHKLYRISNNDDNQREFLADVRVGAAGTFRYTDNNGGKGLEQDSLYCYKVETFGTYNEPKIPSPLRNFSQFACSTPLDTLRPCPPVLAIDPLDCSKWEAGDQNRKIREAFCNETTFQNRLDWTYPDQVDGQKCDKDVVKFRIYYSRYEGENETFVLIDSVVSPQPMPPMNYIHKNLPSFAGCYYVTAVDRSGNESKPSNTVCKDNCPYYELPNVMTPNGDGKNDLFEAFPCPRFVESVHITIVNRWGKKVFESNRSVNVRWDGRLSADGEGGGEELSNGVYYYLAEVKFIRLRRRDEVVKIKGWVQILK